MKVLKEINDAEHDDRPDGFQSLSKSSILLSDLSGVVFDFSFVFKRPVVTIGGNFVKEGFEAWDLAEDAWEVSSYDVIGKRITSTGAESVAEICEVLISVRNSFKEKDDEITTLISEEAINLGCSGKKIADFLIEKSVNSQRHSLKTHPVRRVKLKNILDQSKVKRE